MKIASWLADTVRPLEQVLAEQFAYGNRETMLHNLGISLRYLLLGELQHGWTTSPRYLIQSSHRKRKWNGLLYPLYLWSPTLQQKMIDLGHTETHLVASPWALLVNSLEEYNSKQVLVEKEQSKLILYFPAHSYHGANLNFFENKRIEMIFENYNEYDVIVCLYWLDFINPLVRKLYENLGFKLSCVGYRGSPAGEFPWVDSGGRVNFLPNLYRLLNQASLVFCEEISTAFWAASSLGKPVCVTNTTIETISFWSGKRVSDVDDNRIKLKASSIDEGEVKFGEIIHNMARLKEVARTHFGWDYLASTQNKLIVKSSIILENYFNDGHTIYKILGDQD